MGWVVNVTPRPLYAPGKTRYALYRRLGGPQSRSGHVRKTRPPLGFDPRTAQPVASRCTDLAIPAHQGNEVVCTNEGQTCVYVRPNNLVPNKAAFSCFLKEKNISFSF